MTKNKNYVKNGNKSNQKHPDKASLGRTLFRSRFTNLGANEVGDKDKWVRQNNDLFTNTLPKKFLDLLATYISYRQYCC